MSRETKAKSMFTVSLHYKEVLQEEGVTSNDYEDLRDNEEHWAW